jgi:hypothetical protein
MADAPVGYPADSVAQSDVEAKAREIDEKSRRWKRESTSSRSL